ncbi:unnamed protein product [Notodromas monacha]|uniref:Uncharacterized protein n=1 Tax=Notodromas monacha TaxID=399045 RepID=A0A7R9C0F4_9CRUS|nr:unnamed protein product [Notodromas monacha]CAG0923490.1 unnamed protein product [Notodromas monacha]
MMAYWAFTAYGVTLLQEGASTAGMVADSSDYATFFHKESHDFMDFAVRVPVVLIGNLDYSDPEVQGEVERITSLIEGSNPNIADDLYTDSWLRAFLQFLERDGADKDFNVHGIKNFTHVLQKEYLASDPTNVFSRDISYDDDGNIQASRFVFQVQNLKTIDDFRFIMMSFRHLFSTELKDYNITSYHPLYRLGEQASIIGFLLFSFWQS